jgi:hypothetical protein
MKLFPTSRTTACSNYAGERWLIGYARTMFHGGPFEPPRLSSLQEEVARFHDMLEKLGGDFDDESLSASITDAQLLHGPLADTMTHVGQLAFVRRMCGSPVASENFIFAAISAGNLSAHQAEPNAPDEDFGPQQLQILRDTFPGLVVVESGSDRAAHPPAQQARR